MSTVRFVAFGDLHYGWEKKNKKLKPIHNQRAIDLTLEFTKDYKPDKIYVVGDLLDAHEVSHWNKSKKLSTEGLRLRKSFLECQTKFVEPLEDIADDNDAEINYILGNHERWISDVIEDNPVLDGFLDLDEELQLGLRWQIYPQGTVLNLGKLHFLHGENISGSTRDLLINVADYEASIRVWHHHTFGAITKRSAVAAKNLKNGMFVPGLCDRAPGYANRKPNSWVHGFLWGEVDTKSGYFSDQVKIITDKGFWHMGKHYE